MRELKTDGSWPANTKLRSSKYLNNLIEQDHLGVKQRIAVMLGFKEFRNRSTSSSSCGLPFPRQWIMTYRLLTVRRALDQWRNALPHDWRTFLSPDAVGPVRG
jgi:transposase-like protein